jgi:hypothetical protein
MSLPLAYIKLAGRKHPTLLRRIRVGKRAPGREANGHALEARK